MSFDEYYNTYYVEYFMKYKTSITWLTLTWHDFALILGVYAAVKMLLGRPFQPCDS